MLLVLSNNQSIIIFIGKTAAACINFLNCSIVKVLMSSFLSKQYTRQHVLRSDLISPQKFLQSALSRRDVLYVYISKSRLLIAVLKPSRVNILLFKPEFRIRLSTSFVSPMNASCKLGTYPT